LAAGDFIHRFHIHSQGDEVATNLCRSSLPTHGWKGSWVGRRSLRAGSTGRGL